MVEIPMLPSTQEELEISFPIGKKTMKQVCMFDPKTKKVVNGIIIKPYAFQGYSNKSINSFVSCPNEDYIVFPTTCRMAIYDLNKENMTYFENNFNSNTLCQIASGINIQNGLIVAYSEEPAKENYEAKVIIESLKTPKTIFRIDHKHLSPTNNGIIEIMQMIIPNGSKYLITLARNVSTMKINITIFNPLKEKIVVTEEVSSKICKIDFSTSETPILIACGKAYLHYFKFLEKILAEDPIPAISKEIEQEMNFIDVKFIHKSMLFAVVSDANIIYLIKLNEILCTYCPDLEIRNSFQLDSTTLLARPIEEIMVEGSNEEKPEDSLSNPQRIKNKPQINVISANKTCIIIGSKGGAFVSILEIKKETEIHLFKTYYLGIDYVDITSISSTSNTIALAARQRNKISDKNEDNSEELHNYTINLILFTSFLNADSNISQNIKHIQPGGNNSSPFIKISIGIARNIMVCLNASQIIRVCEFKNEIKQVAKFDHINSIPYDVAMHPLGYQFAVGTKEGVEFYLILEGEAKLMSTIEGKPTHCVEFSKGGGYLAAGMGMKICIFDPYTQEMKYQLSNHTSPIKLLQWAMNDSLLLSACFGGSVYGWVSRFEYHSTDPNIDESGKSEQIKSMNNNRIEYQTKNVKFSGLDYDEEFDILVTCGNDKKLILSNEHGTHNYLELDMGPLVPCSLLLSKQIQFLFVGTNVGTIRTYLWPINKNRNIEYLDYQIHSKEVTSIVMSSDLQRIFSCSKDGSIVGCKLVDIIGENQGLSNILGRRKQNNELSAFKTHVSLDTLTLIYRNTISQKLEEIKSLEEDIKEKEENAKLEIQKIEKMHEQCMAQINLDNLKRLEDEKNRYKKLQDEYEQERKALQKLIEDTKEDARKNDEDVDKSNQEKLKKAYANHEDLIKTLDETKNRFKMEVEAILEKNKDVLNSLQKEHQAKYDDLLKKYNDLVRDMKRDRMKFDETLEQCEQEYEKELIKRNKDNEARLLEERRLQEEIQKKKDDAKKELEEKCKFLIQSEEESKLYKAEKDRLEIEAQKKNTDLIQIQELLSDKEDIIRVKEKSVTDLKVSNQHLENFRFVLDHKISALKNEKIPMEMQIKNLEEQINKMFNELEEESVNKKRLISGVEELKNKLDSAKQGLSKKEDEVRQGKRKLELLQFELTTLMKESDFGLWPKNLKQIYSDFFEEITAKPKENLDDLRIDKPPIEQKIRDASNLKLREELVRQKEWTHKKLVKVVQQNDKLKKDKKDYVIKMQQQNSELINECNNLRHDNQGVAKSINNLEKKLKELTTISNSDPKDIEKKLEMMLKQISTRKVNVGEQKDTPFVKKMKESGISARNKTILDYYSKLYAGQDASQENENEDLLGDLDKNKNILFKQHEEIEKMQQKVNQFLIKNEFPSEGTQLPISLPPITKFQINKENQNEFDIPLGENNIEFKEGMEAPSSNLENDLNKDSEKNRENNLNKNQDKAI